VEHCLSRKKQTGNALGSVSWVRASFQAEAAPVRELSTWSPLRTLHRLTDRKCM
jgi:hypothetical protein